MPEENDLSGIIKQAVGSFSPEAKLEEIGIVVESGDGIVHVAGLPNAMAGELIKLPGNYYGMVFDLERDMVQAILFGPHTAVREGDLARCTGRVMDVPVGEALIGRVVDALGQPLDGLGPVKTDRRRAVEQPAPGVIDRTPVDRPLQSGYKLVDALIPIGRGQRELIIGDRATGKSTLAVDTILSQKGKGIVCLYVAIGQKAATIAGLIQTLREHGALEYTVIVSASASDSISFQYLAPFSGCTMAEDFMLRGKDVLIVYDDLTKHAQAYRTISLLLRRPPGREAFPGDVFYLHSRLLERAAKLGPKLGGGSMTALPIVETQLGDISSYIPTNLISITDGQIFLETDLFNSGIRPAVNVGISVSRVGGKAQVPAIRKIAGRLRLDLAQYREKQAFSLFAADIDEETKGQLKRGELMTEVLKQTKNQPLAVEEQILIIFAAVNGFLDAIPTTDVAATEKKLIAYIKQRAPELLPELSALAPETETRLAAALKRFLELNQ